MAIKNKVIREVTNTLLDKLEELEDRIIAMNEGAVENDDGLLSLGRIEGFAMALKILGHAGIIDHGLDLSETEI